MTNPIQNRAKIKELDNTPNLSPDAPECDFKGMKSMTKGKHQGEDK